MLITLNRINASTFGDACAKPSKSNVDNLARKTVLGFTQLIAVLGVLLFAPAWTLDYWQAWVYLLIFAASSALITTYLWKKDPKLLQRRLDAGPD